MIPVRLKFQGIYSYQKEQIIDFTRLTGAGIFGIFGPVGSGKSTILEAMSFALFNKIDRLSGDNRNYNMMNLKSDRLFIGFEFIANNGVTYRIEVTGRRNSKNFSDVPTFKRSFCYLSGENWIPMGDATAESVTGLSYENFHRTIIIPQGRFQEFLQLNVKERVTMLKELFGLNKYDLSDKTAILEKENYEKLHNLEGQLQQIGDIKPEDITSLKQQIDETQKSLDNIAGELRKAQGRDKVLEELKKHSEDLIKLKEKLSELQSKELIFSNMEKDVREYETLFLAFHAVFEQLGDLNSAFEKQIADLNIRKNEFNELLNESTERQKEFDGLKPVYERREELLRQAEEIKKIAQVMNLEEIIKRITDESRKEKDNLSDLEMAVRRGKESLKFSSEQLIKTKENLPDLKVLSEIKNWFRADRSLKDQIAKEKQAVNGQKEKLTAGRNEAFRISGTLLTIDMTPESFDLSDCVTLIEKVHAEAEKSLKFLQPEISELEIQKRLEKFAGELQEGKPCPLCGSKDHPHILDIHDVSEKLDSTLKIRDNLDNEIKKLTKGEKELTGLQTEISLTEKQAKMHQENLDDLIAKLEEHRQKFIWEPFNPDQEKRVDEEMKRYDDLCLRIKEIELKTDELNRSVADEEVRRENLSSKIRISENKITEGKTQVDLLTGQLKVLTREEWAGYSQKELEAKAVSLLAENALIIRKYKLIEEQIKGLRSKIDTLKGTIASAEMQVDTTTKQREQLSQKIAVKLSQHGGLESVYVEEVIKKEIDLDKSKKEIASYRTELESVKSQELKTETELAGREYPGQEHQAVKVQLTTLQVRLDEINQQMGKLKISLATLEKNLKALETLKKEQERLLLRANNLNTLKSLFRGAAFVNFASRAYLENIIVAANARFRKLTRQHLELVLDEDNNFMLRDHMNEGRLRSIKTLSGGQTFQASLSLALALADNVNLQVEADQNFFFLDEGFGSLDKESLGIVFETLKSLRKENRIVGVISHVEEMQQEIDAHLIISMDDAEGSMIRSSLY